MKKIFLNHLVCFVIIFLTTTLNNLNGQTFRIGFDHLDYSNSGGNGQGASFSSNVINDLSNNESVALQGLINMFKATKDKKYLDKFIIQSKRVQERRDDNIKNLPLK